MYEIRAIFVTEEKASKVCAILKRMVDVCNITKFTVLPEVMQYEGNLYCFFIDFEDEYVCKTLQDVIVEFGGATFLRAC